MKLETLLEQHQIPFILSGKNVKLGNINIKCPFCTDDPSYHCGINEQKKVFACWRDQKHSGSLVFLIKKLLNCSLENAKKLLGESFSFIDFNQFETLTFEIETEEKVCSLPEEFEDFNPKAYRQHKISRYLTQRGFNLEQLLFYPLMTAMEGSFKDRIIFVNHYQGTLINWVGRSIYKGAEIRYLASKESVNIKDSLLFYDLMKGDYLVVVEGPFDALKIDVFGKEYGLRSTCLFGNQISKTQIALLTELSVSFKKIMILLDRGEEDRQDSLVQQCQSILECEVVGGDYDSFPYLKDFGEAGPKEIQQLYRKLHSWV